MPYYVMFGIERGDITREFDVVRRDNNKRQLQVDMRYLSDEYCELQIVELPNDSEETIQAAKDSLNWG